MQNRQYGIRCPTDRSNGGDDVRRWRHDVSLGHRAPIARVLALVLATLVALAGGTAAVAAPPSRPPTPPWPPRPGRSRKLDAQHAEVERLAERLNATEDNRDRLRVSLRRLQARQKAAQAELDTAQAQLDEQARATYMQGPPGCSGSWSAGRQPARRPAPAADAAGRPRGQGRGRHRGPGPQGRGRQPQRAGRGRPRRGRPRPPAPGRRAAPGPAPRRAAPEHPGQDRQQLAGYLEAEQSRAEASRRAAWAGYMSGVGTVQSWLQAGPVARAAVRWALAQLGDPYQWGAAGPTGSTARG